MSQDEIIQEVRAIREAYAERFGFDIRALVQDAQARAREEGRKVVSPQPRRVELAASHARSEQDDKP